MNPILNFIQKSLDKFDTPRKIETEKAVITPIEKSDINKVNKKIRPAERSSQPEPDLGLGFLTDKWAKPDVALEVIPRIRSLVRSNEDVGSIFNDLIQLTNTGHTISFDSSVSPEQANRLRKHLIEKSQSWGSGVHGIDGLVNKWIAQIWVSGALSNEWIPANDFSGVENAALVSPENILFKYNKTTTRYEAYQKVKGKLLATNPLVNAVKLNPNTYFYAGILNDTDSPYGIPPFLTALEALADQKMMKKNIKHILKQVGLLGYLQVKSDKPQQEPDESIPAYEARLKQYLADVKKSVQGGFMEGIVVGFNDDHDFQFNSTAKNINGVSELFNLNEIQISNGLKTSPSFLGQKSGGTETNMGIVFTKMLSQLKSIQKIIAANLSMGYLLEARMFGVNLKYVKVEFGPSTITDDLKYWQSMEIKQRVAKELAIDNVISQQTYAEIMGYDKPNGNKPLVPYKDQVGKSSTDQKSKEEREAGKDKSDRTGRDKKKAQPRRKDQDTKER